MNQAEYVTDREELKRRQVCRRERAAVLSREDMARELLHQHVSKRDRLAGMGALVPIGRAIGIGEMRRGDT